MILRNSSEHFYFLRKISKYLMTFSVFAKNFPKIIQLFSSCLALFAKTFEKTNNFCDNFRKNILVYLMSSKYFHKNGTFKRHVLIIFRKLFAKNFEYFRNFAYTVQCNLIYFQNCFILLRSLPKLLHERTRTRNVSCKKTTKGN